MKEILVEKGVKYYTLEEILENIDKIDFEGITLNTSCVVTFKNDETVKLLYTNEDNPFSVGEKLNNFSSMLMINKDYYLKHKDYVDGLLKLIIEKRKKSNIDLTGNELINSEQIIDAIKTNSSIETVSLYGDDDEYKLDSKMYEKLKASKHIKRINTKSVTDELKENFDPIIGCNSGTLYSFYSYKDLISSSTITLSPDEENIKKMHYLKYINPNATLKINLNENFPLPLIFQNIDSLNLHNKIEINVTDKNSLNRIIFNNLDFYLSRNIDIKLGLNSYPIATYVNYEKRLLDMIKPAMNLSPLERYLFAYNIVKQYKPYKENDEDRLKARNVYDVLDNEFMVCVGYANLLIDLLSKLGITSVEYGDSVNIGYDKNKNVDMTATDSIAAPGPHARVEFKMDDDKYGVHGIYIADPTWDNYMDYDSYCFAFMTRREHESLNRENFYSKYMANDLFDANSIEEFYKKVNYKLDTLDRTSKTDLNKNIEKQFKKSNDKLANNQYFTSEKIMDFIIKVMHDKYNMNKGNQYFNHYSKEMLLKNIFSDVVDNYKFSSITNDEELTELIINRCDAIYNRAMKGPEKQVYNVINDLLGHIKIFNSSLYEQIINKYPTLNSTNKNLSDKEISDIITTIGNYIVSVNNNYVSGETIISAACELYKKSGLSDEEIKEKLTKTIEFNKKHNAAVYPKRMRINPDGTEEVYMNPENKFDEEHVHVR